ncbi:hypothetical protein KY290_023061 [Solanum tuberosum]|uniref:SET domain-containing protein n=1 Tax=Solanum tuberosum TaxID=4113 RepID=A0ABQ7V781_SOLTU|nr:hypothetical protein KY290_023061 [Solanum tuberosum]
MLRNWNLYLIELALFQAVVRFQKCEYAKTKLFRTEGSGWGLLADENIKVGQFIMECCLDVISFEELKKRSQAYESHEEVYIISMDANNFIDSTRKGSFARFIHHSWMRALCSNPETLIHNLKGFSIMAQDIDFTKECGRCAHIGKHNKKKGSLLEFNHVWENGDDRLSSCRYIVDDLPVYDSTDDESTPVISDTSGGNEHTRILNDGEGSTFKLVPTNRATKKNSQRKPKLRSDISFLLLFLVFSCHDPI